MKLFRKVPETETTGLRILNTLRLLIAEVKTKHCLGGRKCGREGKGVVFTMAMMA